MRQWRNWSGYLTASPGAILQPHDAEALSEIVRNGRRPLRVTGSGHSFTPLVPTDSTIINLDRIAGITAHDAERMTATFGAGTKLHQLTPALDAIGQALPNMGDIDIQSVGGALGTATHGTGPGLGAYHTLIDRLTLVDGTGAIRSFDRESGMIEALGVTLGAFGILTEVTFRNMASYRLRKRRRTLPIGEMLSQFEAMMGGHRSAEFYYIPHSGTALFLASDITTDAVTSRPPDDDEDGLRTLSRLRDYLGWARPLRRALISAAISRIPPEDYVETWFKVYTSERKTRFNEMEYHLPVEEGPKVLEKIIAVTERDFPDVYFPMEVRTVAADEFWLSPFYRRPTCSIAIHHDAPRDPVKFQTACEAIFRAHGGRPHWGKMHSLTATDFRALYPKWDEAMEVRRSLDPEGAFLSPYLKRILGAE